MLSLNKLSSFSCLCLAVVLVQFLGGSEGRAVDSKQVPLQLEQEDSHVDRDQSLYQILFRIEKPDGDVLVEHRPVFDDGHPETVRLLSVAPPPQSSLDFLFANASIRTSLKADCRLNPQFQPPFVPFALLFRWNPSNATRACNLSTSVAVASTTGASAIFYFSSDPSVYDQQASDLLPSQSDQGPSVWLIGEGLGWTLYQSAIFARDRELQLWITVESIMVGWMSIWEYTISIAIILLAITFLASGSLHCHMYRRRRQMAALAFTQNSHEMQNMSGQIPNAHVLSQEELASLPTFHYGHSPITPGSKDPRDPRLKTCSDSSLTLDGLVGLERNVSAETLGSNVAIASAWFDNDDVCVICIQPFELEENLRLLPCGHRFHTDCIDCWLVGVHAICPMCKAEVHVRDNSGSEDESDR